ncbi:MAG: hypothetical protein OEM98_19300 [Gammaproteobacteria bacterium]|nr:hypothetical protein [Gammaproteobacteria bacterium]
MNGAKQSSAGCGDRHPQSVRAHAILTRHFGFPESDVEAYFARAAARERRKVTEIEKAVIRLAGDFF